MRSRQLLVLTLVGVFAVACERTDETDTDTDAIPGAETQPLPETTPTTPEGVTGDLVVSRSDFEEVDGAGDMDVKGHAELRRTAATADAGLELTARLEGLKAQHAWHIHRGACEVKDAPVAVPFTQPLVAGADGVAEQTVPIAADQLTQQQIDAEAFSVRVHAGGSDAPGATIACANIQRR